MGCGTSSGRGPEPPKVDLLEASPGTLLEKYKLGKTLGQGAFGIVYSCKSKQTEADYAVKMVDKAETPLEDIKMEAEMLQKLAHPCVVKLHDIYYDKVFVCLIMDICRGGDMIGGMMTHWDKRGKLPPKVVARLTKQMLESIAWLHGHLVVHRDIKGDNYLMSRPDIQSPEVRVYLSDFGTVCRVNAGERLKDRVGTRLYWPPEMFHQNYGLKVDVWAAGVVMYACVTGRFPFNDESEVLEREVWKPVCNSQCQDLVMKALVRKEADRLTAEEALDHPFIASQQSFGPSVSESSEAGDLDFKPEIKESAVNAGIAERRHELIERLEEAQAAGKSQTLGFLIDRDEFTVANRQTGRTSRYRWQSSEKEAKDLMTFPDAKPLQDDTKSNAETSADEIRKTLESHGTNTSKFGTGEAKSFEDLVYEVQSGSSRLMLDAEKCQSIVRVLDVVVLRIICKTEEGEKYLVLMDEQFPDGRAKKDVNQLPGGKKEPHENSVQAAIRILQDRLQITLCKIEFDFMSKECFEEEENSHSYPGVRTVYRKEVFEGRIRTTDSTVLQHIGATSNGKRWTNKDPQGYTRTFDWLSKAECGKRGVRLVAEAKRGEVSALVHAPVGIGEEDLRAFLKSSDIDVSKFAAGQNKTLRDFSDELVKGDAALVRQADGKLVRIVDIVVLKIARGSSVLVEVEEEEEADGAKRSLHRLPATKRRPDENMFLAAQRLITNVLKVNSIFISLEPRGIQFVEEWKASDHYFGLPTLYKKRIISAAVCQGNCRCTFLAI